ncbi:MAG: hydrogenase maturation protease [Armatimonadota bacterium]|nr:hydrogenase maturation protease [Armatimonadota bacterium]
MNGELRDVLRVALAGRPCLVGMGNADRCDDGFGVRLAEALADAGADVIVAGTTPERWIGHLARSGFDNVVFLDAVDVGAPPGSAVLMDAGDVEAAVPQISTHKLSVGTLAKLLRAQSRARVWLLGVQPVSVREGTGLSAPVEASLHALETLVRAALRSRPAAQARRVVA